MTMIKPVVTRNLMLEFVPDEFEIPVEVNASRVFKLNDKAIKDGQVVYLMSRELRLEDNWGLLFAFNLAKEKKRDFKVIISLDEKIYSKRQREFINLDVLKNNLTQNNSSYEILKDELNLEDVGALVVDFNPVDLKIDLAKKVACAVFEVDSHNIIPSRYISDKQEFSAATLRRKIYANIGGFLTEFPQPFKIDKSEAVLELENFIENKLENYSADKNDPNKSAVSNLSKYLHCGQICSQRIALEVLKSDVARENKETFLEELIVRKELADNFCLHNPSYKTLDAIPNWAKESLNSHRADIRAYAYDLREFENGKTHDRLWNACQKRLVKDGKIHGYLRMYWAKKILEWSSSPEDALNIAIYLNDKYALDGNDSNGYVGILWSIGGVHDRPFANRMVSGKIRYMSLEGCKKKFDVAKYVEEGEKD